MEDTLAQLRRRGVVAPELTVCTPLTGGTSDTAWALARGGGAPPELVVKRTRPHEGQATALFLETYRSLPLLPAIRYADPAGAFLVYAYRPGALLRHVERGVDKGAALLALVRDLIGRYVPAPADAPPGWLADALNDEVDPHRTWQTVLAEAVAYRHAILAPYLPAADGALVEALAGAPGRKGDGPLSLLHGDCGAHNFLCATSSPAPDPSAGAGADAGGAEAEAEAELVGVIDPDPIVGEPIYDLAFAFASWPAGLRLETLLPAADALVASGRWRPAGDRVRVLIEEAVIALYCRLGTCLMHHPEDLPAYLAAWPAWKTLLAAG